jgi:hypothetical protein
VIVPVHVLEARSGAMDEEHAHISIASLADAQELALAAGAVLSWHESKPCSELTALAEADACAAIRHSRHLSRYPEVHVAVKRGLL